MNYTNIFASLDTDSQKIVISGDWKEYFRDKPYPDHIKQSWLIKRVMDLEATPHGQIILQKDNEIAELKAKVATLENQGQKETQGKNEYKKQVQALQKKLITVINESQKRADDRITEIRNFYAGIISVDKAGLLSKITDLNKTVATLQRVNQEWRIEAENNWNDYNDMWDEMMKAETKFADLKVKTTQEQEDSEKKHKDKVDEIIKDKKLDYANFLLALNTLEEQHRQNEKEANDDKETLEKEHAQKLKKIDTDLQVANQKLFDLINKPVATTETQTDLTAEKLDKFAKNVWRNLLVIQSRLQLLSGASYISVSGKATQFSKDYGAWLNTYETKWNELLTLLSQGERERERERERDRHHQ